MAYLELFGRVIGYILLGAVLSAVLFCWPFQLLWNWLMPDLFGLSPITVWQSWGLLTMSGFLFKSTSSQKSE